MVKVILDDHGGMRGRGRIGAELAFTSDTGDGGEEDAEENTRRISFNVTVRGENGDHERVVVAAHGRDS